MKHFLPGSRVFLTQCLSSKQQPAVTASLGFDARERGAPAPTGTCWVAHLPQLQVPPPYGSKFSPPPHVNSALLALRDDRVSLSSPPEQNLRPSLLKRKLPPFHPPSSRPRISHSPMVLEQPPLAHLGPCHSSPSGASEPLSETKGRVSMRTHDIIACECPMNAPFFSL
ncbi:hypothetical protein E2C01_025536 [Portunus trituberculatus]|uniref:Uncharacterized protein n=1 Tax=Portunus trituberculatus TaxID=210409 RepID=A0A5B7EFI6_PORTR|nr:hypothetical protein [Portunus trituberculatus]